MNTDATRKSEQQQKNVVGHQESAELACLHLDHLALRNSVNVVMKHAAITEATTCNSWAKKYLRSQTTLKSTEHGVPP